MCDEYTLLDMIAGIVGETCTQPRAGSLSLLQQKLPPGVTYDCYFLTGGKEYYAKCAARLIAAVNNSGKILT